MLRKPGSAFLRLSLIIKTLLIVLLLVCVLMFIVKFSQFQLSTNENLIDFENLPVGEWNWYDSIYVYHREYSSLEVVQLDDGTKALKVHTQGDTNNVYTGFGINGPFNIPWNARIEVVWWRDGFFPGVESHIVDKPGEGFEQGEVFSYIWNPLATEPKKDSAPFTNFFRNSFQDESRPKDGQIDSSRLKSLEFGFPNGAQGDIYITSMQFVWAGPEAISLLILPIFFIIGLILTLRSFSIDTYTRISNHFVAPTVTNRFVFIILSVSFLLAVFQDAAIYVHPTGLSLIFYILFVILLDEFVDHPLKLGLIWFLRYALIVLLVGILGFWGNDVEAFTSFFIYLIALLPHIERIQKKSFVIIIFFLFLELLLRPVAFQFEGKFYEFISLTGAALLILFLSEAVLFKEVNIFSSKTMQLYEGLLNQSSDAIFTCTPEGILETVNPGFESLVGQSRKKIEGSHLSEFLVQGEIEKFDTLQEEGFGKNSLELSFIDNMGLTRHTLCRIQNVKNNGVIELYQAIATDITQRKITEDELERNNKELQSQVERDFLTDIPNRRSFDRQFDAYWQESIITNQNLAVILGDVDFFKAYNDTYGHQIGDHCLRTIAQALQASARRAGEFCARYGGEEFAFLIPRVNKIELEQILERIRLSVYDLAIEHENSGEYKRVTISLGAALFSGPDSHRTPAQFLDKADQALYSAKDNGRNCWRIDLPL